MNFKTSKTAAIAAILMLTIAIPLVAIPIVNAHNPPWEIETFAYINAAPSPVGVGQKVDVLIWVDKPRVSAALSNEYRMHNFRLIITDSAGTQVLNQFWEDVVDPTSSQYYAWTPSAVGTYNLTFNFEGFAVNDFPTSNTEVNDTYLPDSASTTVVVQEEQLPSPITSYPLPMEYWTRPIFGENTDWWSISSNWLGESSPTITAWPAIFGYGNLAGIDRDPGAGVGPETSHVMWTMPIQFGGVAGDDNFPIRGNTFFEGSAYSQRFQNPIILAGRLYFNQPLGYTGTGSGPETCVDLRSGEVIWETYDLPQFDFGIIYDVEDPQQHGVYPPMLIDQSGGGFFGGGVTWHIYDAYTGEFMVDATGIPTGVSALGPQGEYLIYEIANEGNNSNPDYHLRLWNSSLLWTGTGWANPTSSGLSPAWDTTTTTTTTNETTGYVNGQPILTPTTTTTTAVDASISSGTHTRYSWDVPISWRNDMSPAPGYIFGSTTYNDVLVMRQGTQPGLTPGGFGTNSQAPYTYIGINLKDDGHQGTLMWSNTLQPPERNITVTTGIIDPVSRIFTETYKETRQHVGFDLDTGQYLWTTGMQPDLDYYGNPSIPWLASASYQGRLYSGAYGGILYCYDERTGDVLWTYGNGGEGNSTNSGFEVPGPYPTTIYAVAGGVLYTITGEHTFETPIFKGAVSRAINATDGTEIWTLSSAVASSSLTAIADGYATWCNGYDNQIYVVGRGPSATTVSAPDVAASFGTPVVIKGTVMDISAGTTQNEQAARFPNGVPAMSDASMKDWMGYVYQQQPLPADAVGVNVTLSVIDSNTNCYDIGTTTTDANGFFSYEWTPAIPGKFTVFATFAGTNGYWPSQAETAFTVMKAPTATTEPTPQPASAADLYFLPMSIGTIVAIVAIGLVLILMLRKR